MKQTILILMTAAALVACGKKPTAAPVATTSQPAATPAAVATQPVTAAAAINSASEAPVANAAPVSGTILETMDAAGYTYLKLKTQAGEVWAAVPQTKAKVGQPVTLVGTMELEKFESKTLKRTFDHIIFGQIGQPGGAPAPMTSAASTPPPNPHAGMMPGANAPKLDLASIKVEKASGSDAKTVAELWSEKSLKDAPVTVRGKVVKFLPGIMGKNWLHLRDGSVDNDITVTTDDTAAVGDVITVKGTVHRDKDFGAGYNYAVIIEDAKVSK